MSKDYKKLYEEALERAKIFKSPYCQHATEVIFPELKESEDERIRKGLIKGLSAMRDIHNHQTFSDDAININDAIAWLEKQGEQKPDDKVEPKFKVGDWVIVQDKTPCRIEKVTESPNNHYQYWTTDEHWFGDGTEARLWTIQDAKNGDILAAYECYVIFKEIDDLNIKCYCTYHCMNNPMFFINTLQNKTAFHPATKEQCDLLFQKMKEAGYEWDAKKKELTKINKQIYYHNDGLYYAIDILEKTLGKVEGYQSDDGILEHKCAISAVKKLAEQKSDWSEEDEKRLLRIHQFIWANRKGDTDEIYQQEQDADWLKSLKPNHWKPSEYDISLLEEIAKNIRNNVRPFCSEVSSLEDLIENLKTL